MIESLQHLRQTDSLLEQTLAKYQRQIDDIETQVKSGLRSGVNKQILLSKLRRKKIIMFYSEQARLKRDQIVQRQFALEQLNITTMQLEAMKKTASVFRNFNRVHGSIDKIEQLQDTIEEHADQLLEIDSIINKEIALDWTEDELEQELNELVAEPQEIELEVFPTVPSEIQSDIKSDGIYQEKIPLLN